MSYLFIVLPLNNSDLIFIDVKKKKNYYYNFEIHILAITNRQQIWEYKKIEQYIA